MLTQEQVEAYHARGYISVEGVFSDTEIEELRRVTDEFVERSRQVTENDEDFDLEPGHSAAAPRLRRLKHPEQLHPAYDRIFRDSRVLDKVAQLIGPDIRHFSGKLNMKSAGFGSPVEWHQDYAFCARTNEDILAVGVAIDDMSLENGCLLVVPGSHRGPIYNHYQEEFFVGPSPTAAHRRSTVPEPAVIRPGRYQSLRAVPSGFRGLRKNHNEKKEKHSTRSLSAPGGTRGVDRRLPSTLSFLKIALFCPKERALFYLRSPACKLPGRSRQHVA